MTLRKILLRTVVVGILIFFIISGIEFISGVRAYRSSVNIDSNFYNNVMAFDRVIALTFDDGPDPLKTQKILEVLKKHQVPATFFFTGTQALKYPDIVQMVGDSGYEIGNHTFSHSENVHSSPKRLEFELDLTNKIIGNITGTQTVLYRPPYLLDIGSDPLLDKNDNSLILESALANGYIPIGADIDSYDWRAKSKEEIIANVIKQIDDGHIVLLHDGSQAKFTVEAIDELIPILKEKDYRFVTVSDIIGLNAAEYMTPFENLEFGATDTEVNGNVSKMQAFLLREGYYGHVPSGVFDEETSESLIAWQEDQQLTDELGYLGPHSREVITSILDGIVIDAGWPSAFRNSILQEIERNFQFFTIEMSAVSGNNLPLIIRFVIALVLIRLLIISILYPFAIRRNSFQLKKTRHWNGGVSVIIPAYNEEENIAATIESILQTKRKKLELIVVDDGSTDATNIVVSDLQKKYPEKIKLFYQHNSGKASALNHGVAVAKYGVVVCVDGDTVFTPNTIKSLVRPFGQSEVGAVAGKVCATESNHLISQFQHMEYVISQNIDKLSFGYINAINVVPGPVGAWRKNLLLKLGGYSDDTLVEDQDLTLAVLASGSKILYEPKAIAYTETPFKIRDFIKQRLRWILGTAQCLIKYRGHILNPRSKSLGMIVMPITIIYTFILPLLYPLMDVLFVGWLAFNLFQQQWILFALFILIDLFYALLGFAEEKKKKLVLLWFPLQRIFYRSVIWYVVLVSVWKIIEGGEMLWKKVAKRGDAQLQFLSNNPEYATNELRRS